VGPGGIREALRAAREGGGKEAREDDIKLSFQSASFSSFSSLALRRLFPIRSPVRRELS